MARPLRLVYVAPRPFSLAFGGLEVQLLQTRLALQGLGVPVSLLDPYSMDELRCGDLVHVFGSDHVVVQLTDALAGVGARYVNSPVFYPTGIRRMAQRLAARLPRDVTAMRGRVLRHAARVLPNSRGEARALQQVFGLHPQQVTVIPNGVDPGFVGADPERFRRLYLDGLPPGEPFVLSVSRIERRKNNLALIKAASRLRVPLVLIGQPNPLEPDYGARFADAVRNYPGYLKHLPFFPPGSADLADAYAAAQVHALLSWLETPGLVSLEAGLNGANLVVGRCEPVREYLGDLAWLVEPADPRAAAGALEEAMNAPRDAHGQAAAIAARYAWQRVGELTLGVYREVLAS